MIGELLSARPRATTLLALILIGSGLTVGLAREALADYSFRCATSPCGNTQIIDHDRYVPEFSGDPISSHYDDYIGYAWSYKDFYWHRWIEYDAVEMQNHCANTWTWNALYAHERAHSRGWSHGEAPSNLNAAYNRVTYTPC